MAAWVLVLAVAILVIHGTAAQRPGPEPGPAPGPAPEEDCFTMLLGMADCLPYVSKESNETTPDKNCCLELAGLVKSSPKCLCQLLSDPDKAGYSIDAARAIKLPTACNVSTPPLNLCSLFGYPVGPAPSPAPGVQPPSGDSGDTPGNSGNKASSINRVHLAFPMCLAFAFLPTVL